MTPLALKLIMHKNGVQMAQGDWERMPWRDAYLLGMMLQEMGEA